MNILAQAPDKMNFLPLLKEALANNHHFAYKRVPWGRNFYIHQDTARVITYILDRLDDGYRADLLELVPLHMTKLAMECWKIKGDQVKYRHWFKYQELPQREFHQHELEFMEEKR